MGMLIHAPLLAQSAVHFSEDFAAIDNRRVRLKKGEIS
jgi:hypothetical protein